MRGAGPILVDGSGNSFISWTGSSSAAGFLSYDPSGAQRWQTFCERTRNSNYDVSAIAIDNSSALYFSCYFWQSIYQNVITKAPPMPTTAQPTDWQGRSCSVVVDPLIVRNGSESELKKKSATFLRLRRILSV
jgi:hypothetical protein